MKRLHIFTAAVCLVGCAHAAVNWTGNARNNFYVNEQNNWSGSIWNQALCIIDVQPTQRLTLKPGYNTFFGGAELKNEWPSLFRHGR